MNKYYILLLAVLLASVYAENGNNDNDKGDDNDDDKLNSINLKNCGLRPKLTKSPNFTDKIVDGQPAQEGDWGWQVALLYSGRLSCGGTLINRKWVLTASHCVYGYVLSLTFFVKKSPSLTFFVLAYDYRNRNPLVYSILVGSADRANLASSAQRRNVAKVILHPQYNPSIIKNDVALLKLDVI
jgi:hypothetical protein